MFHLRHIGPSSQSDSLICLKKTVTIIGRKRDEVDHVICSHNYKMNAIVSRRHCRLKAIDGIIEVIDDSRNGVFVNDVKIDGRVVITEGDVVTMGHPSGEKLKSGTRARQPNSEYQYILERCFCEETNQETISATNRESVIANKSIRTDEQNISMLPTVKTAPQTVSDRVLASFTVLKESNNKRHLATPLQQSSDGSVKSPVEHKRNVNNIPAQQENANSVDVQLHVRSGHLEGPSDIPVSSKPCNKTAAESVSALQTVSSKPEKKEGTTCISAPTHKSDPLIPLKMSPSMGHVPESSEDDSARKITLLSAQSDNTVENNHNTLLKSADQMEINPDLPTEPRIFLEKVHDRDVSVEENFRSKESNEPKKAPASPPQLELGALSGDGCSLQANSMVRVETEHILPNNSEDIKVSSCVFVSSLKNNHSLSCELEAVTGKVSVSQPVENRSCETLSRKDDVIKESCLHPEKNNQVEQSKLEDILVVSPKNCQIKLSKSKNVKGENPLSVPRPKLSSESDAIMLTESDTLKDDGQPVHSVISTEQGSRVVSEADQIESEVSEDVVTSFEKEITMEKDHIFEACSENLRKEQLPVHESICSIEVRQNESEGSITKCASFQQELSLEKNLIKITKHDLESGSKEIIPNKVESSSYLSQISTEKSHDLTTRSEPMIENDPGHEFLISGDDIVSKSGVVLSSRSSEEKITAITCKLEDRIDEDQAAKLDCKVSMVPEIIMPKDDSLSSQEENHIISKSEITLQEDKESKEAHPTESESFITKGVTLSPKSEISMETSCAMMVKSKDIVNKDQVSKELIETSTENNYVLRTKSEDLGQEDRVSELNFFEVESKVLSSEPQITKEKNHISTSKSENSGEADCISGNESKDFTPDELKALKMEDSTASFEPKISTEQKLVTKTKLDNIIEKDVLSFSQQKATVSEPENRLNSVFGSLSQTEVFVEKGGVGLVSLGPHEIEKRSQSDNCTTGTCVIPVDKDCFLARDADASQRKDVFTSAESQNLMKNDAVSVPVNVHSGYLIENSQISVAGQRVSAAVDDGAQSETETSASCDPDSTSKQESSKMNVADEAVARKGVQNAGARTPVDLDDSDGGMGLDSLSRLEEDAGKSQCSGEALAGTCVDEGCTSPRADPISVNKPVVGNLCEDLFTNKADRLPQKDAFSLKLDRSLGDPLPIKQHTPKQHVRLMKRPHSCEPPNKRLRREFTSNLAPLCLSPGLASQYLKSPGPPQFSYVESILTGVLNHGETEETEEHQFSDAEIDAESSSSCDPGGDDALELGEQNASIEDCMKSGQENVANLASPDVKQNSATDVSGNNMRTDDSGCKSNLPFTVMDDLQNEDSLNLYLELSQTSNSKGDSHVHFVEDQKKGQVLVHPNSREGDSQAAEHQRGSQVMKCTPDVLVEKYLCTQCGLVMAMDDKENHCHPDACSSQNSNDSNVDYFLVEDDEEDYRVGLPTDKTEALFLPCSKRRRITFGEDKEPDSTHLNASQSSSDQRSKTNPTKRCLSQRELSNQEMTRDVKFFDTDYMSALSYNKPGSVYVAMSMDKDAGIFSGTDSCTRPVAVEYRAEDARLNGIPNTTAADQMVNDVPREGEIVSSGSHQHTDVDVVDVVPCLLTNNGAGLSDSPAVKMQTEHGDAKRVTRNNNADGSDSSRLTANVTDRQNTKHHTEKSALGDQKAQQNSELCTSGDQMNQLQKETVDTKSDMNQLLTKAYTSDGQLNQLQGAVALRNQNAEVVRDICATDGQENQKHTEVCANESHITPSTETYVIDSQSITDGKMTSSSILLSPTDSEDGQVYGSDVEARLVDIRVSHPDKQTSGVDNQPDTQTSAIDSLPGTQTSFHSKPDTQTSGFHSRQAQPDTQTSAVDNQPDTQTSVDSQPDTQTSAVDSQDDTQTSAVDSQDDTQTSAVDSQDDTQTSAELSSVVNFQGLKQAKITKPKDDANDMIQKNQEMEIEDADLSMDVVSTQTLDDKAELSPVICPHKNSDGICLDIFATQTLSDEVDEIKSTASTIDSTSLYQESTQHTSRLMGNSQDCQGTQAGDLREDDAVSDAASEESFSLYVEPTQGEGSTCATSDHCNVVFSQMSEDSDILQPRIQDIIHSLEDASSTNVPNNQVRIEGGGDGELSIILEGDEGVRESFENLSGADDATHSSGTSPQVVFTESKCLDCASNEESCSDQDSEVFSPLPCNLTKRPHEKWEDVENGDTINVDVSK